MDRTTIFGFYRSPQQVEVAADHLLHAGFYGSAISALYPDNRSSRDFARKKRTRPPRGTDEPPNANAPLQGTLGLAQPTQGPIRGALAEALEEIGLAADWPGGDRVVHGEILLSVLANSAEAAATAGEILEITGAKDVGSPDGQTIQSE